MSTNQSEINKLANGLFGKCLPYATLILNDKQQPEIRLHDGRGNILDSAVFLNNEWALT